MLRKTPTSGFKTVASGFSRTSGPPEGGHHVRFETTVALPFVATVVTANLTGALLVRAARTLIDAVVPGGILIVSGLQRHERDEVMRALTGTSTTWERTVGEWVGLTVKRT